LSATTRSLRSDFTAISSVSRITPHYSRIADGATPMMGGFLAAGKVSGGSV